MEEFVHEEEEVDHPMRYLPIRHVYSSTAPCTNPGAMSKKVKARKLLQGDRDFGGGDDEERKKPSMEIDRGATKELDGGNAEKPLLVYRRRAKRPRPPTSFFDAVARRMADGEATDTEEEEEEEETAQDIGDVKRRRHQLKNELLRLGAGAGISGGIAGPRLRASGRSLNFAEARKRQRIGPEDSSNLGKAKRWVE